MTKSARFGIVLALLAAACSGRSIRSDAEADPGDPSEGGGTSGTGGVAGTNAGSSGSSSGGSAQGGSSRGGAGTGGENDDPARILFESADTLWATDIDGSDHVELCPPASTPGAYSLVDWVNERAIVFRRNDTPANEGELFSVALDGSECTPFYRGSIVQPLSPVVGGRVVFTVPPMPTSALDPDERPGEPSAIRVPATGLASVALDGTGHEYLGLSGVSAVWIADDRVLFLQAGGPAGYDLYTALPDASVIELLFPVMGDKNVAGVSGRRAVVNVAGDIYAVDVDGSGIAPLSTGPEMDYATTILEDQIIVRRGSSGVEYDLLRIGLDSDELVPLTTRAGSESFLGATSSRVIFEQWTPEGLPDDIFSVSFRGGEPTRLSDTPDSFDPFGGVAGDRVIFAEVFSTATSSRASIKSAREDGSDTITLHDDAVGIMTVVGDRVVFYVHHGLYDGPYDLVSIPAAGGELAVLADSEQEDLLVGRLGQRLIVQRGPEALEGEVLRVNADGTHEISLAPSARYLGAVTESCGAVPGGTQNVTACP